VSLLNSGFHACFCGVRRPAAHRRKALTGLLSGRVVVIAHTETPEVIRIISVRKATKDEEASYFKEIAD
jgi:uncharacterized DUF497 family protein